MSKFIEPKLNKDHVIVYPNLHDSNLTKVELLHEKKAKVLFAIQDVKYEFFFNGIKYFKCSPFRGGNIVFDVTAWCGEEYPEKELRELLEILPGKNGLYIENTLKAISGGKLTLLIVSPSYGCELICLCDSYSIFEL